MSRSFRRLSILGLVVVASQSSGTGTCSKLMAQQRYGLRPNQDAEQVLDSLERVALDGGTPADRVTAVAEMAYRFGRRELGDSSHPEVVARLARLYRQSSDNKVRLLVLRQMPYQAGVEAVAEFLGEVAKEPGPVQDPAAARPRGGLFQSRAVKVLAGLGPAGERMLRALHAEGAVTAPYARQELEQLARQGFRRPEPRQQSHGDSTAEPAPVDTLQTINRTLDSLLQVALKASDRRQRIRAVGQMAFRFGQKTPDGTPTYPGVVARLARVYLATDDEALRQGIIRLMSTQAEVIEAVDFLSDVAREPGPAEPKVEPGAVVLEDDPMGPPQALAISLLLGMGVPGENALRALHAEGAVTTRRARQLLEELVERRLPPPEE